jgi:hypothetical protein
VFETAIFVLMFAVLPVLLSVGLSRFRPRWPRWVRALVAACVLPVPIIAFAAFMAFNAAHTPADECGVDACGMAMAAAMILGFFAVVGLVLGFVLALAVQFSAKR